MKKILIFVSSIVTSLNCFAIKDSTVNVQSGIANVIYKTDTTSDTLYLNKFIKIDDIEIIDVGIANILTISMEEGDLSSYVVVRYKLLDNQCKELYSNRYRISGSSYNHLMESNLGYLYWKICNVKNFTPQD